MPSAGPARLMTVGLLLTAFGLGLRHGIDWDHIAAIADLSSTAESRRRGFMLSFLYAVGHGLVVIVLGVAAIIFGASLPEGVDVWMGRVVGATLVALGAWVLIELLRKGRDFRLRSRWILVLGGTFAGLRRVRGAGTRRKLQIEHDHEHPHEFANETIDLTDLVELSDGAEPADGHRAPAAHDHSHIETAASDSPEPELALESELVLDSELEPAEAGGGSSRFGRLSGWGSGVGLSRPHSHSHSRAHSGSIIHSHRHQHETVLADASSATGNGTAAGIGLLHGIGFESPTQIAVFVASTSVVGIWAGFGLLVAWVLGLIIANSALAVLAAYGLLGAERNFTIYAAVAVFVALASLAMGLFLLFGQDPPLPAL